MNGNDVQQDILIPKKKQYRSFVKMLLITLNACFSSFYFGYCMVYMATVQFTTIKVLYHISDDVSQSLINGVLNGLIPIGAGLGALSSFIIMKKMSRRNLFILTNILAAVGFGIIQIRYLPSLIIGRFIQGFCVGIYSAVTPVYINQILPPSLSRLGALNQANIAFGQSFAFLLAYVLGLGIEETQIWWALSTFPFLILAIQTCVFIFIFNFSTPDYLFAVGKRQQGLQLIDQLYSDSYIPQYLQKQREHTSILDKSSSSSQSSNVKQLEKQQGEQGKKSLNSNSLIAIIAAIHIAFLQQMVGINVIVTYGEQIVGEVLPNQKKIIMIIINFLPAAAAVFTTYVLTKFGRKTILQAGTICLSLVLATCFVGYLIRYKSQVAFQVLLLGSLFLYMIIFGITLGPVVWMYIPQFVTPSVVPFSTMANWFGATLNMLLFPLILSNLLDNDPKFMFLFFMAYSIFGFLVNWRILIETKNKKFIQVQEEYYQKKKCW